MRPGGPGISYEEPAAPVLRVTLIFNSQTARVGNTRAHAHLHDLAEDAGRIRRSSTTTSGFHALEKNEEVDKGGVEGPAADFGHINLLAASHRKILGRDGGKL